MNKKNISGLRTGFNEVDKLTFEKESSELIIVTEKLGMDKLTFILNIVEFVSIGLGKPVVIFSLKEASEELVNRFITFIAGIENKKNKNDLCNPNDWSALVDASTKISNAPLFISDKTEMSVIELESAARKLAMKLEKKKTPLSLIIIDYLQLIKASEKRFKSKKEEIADILKSLKKLAEDLKIPIIALSQFSIQQEKNKEI